MAFRPVYRPDDPEWKTVEGPEEGPEVFADLVNPHKGTPVTSLPDGWGHSVPVEGRTIASSASFDKGDLVRKDGSDNLVEASAVTDTIYGVAQEAVSNGAALGVVTDKAIIALVEWSDDATTGRDLPNVKTVFATTDVNGTTPTSSHVGTKCALSLSGGDWEIDVSNTSNQDVEILRIEPTRDQFYVKFLDAAIQS